MYAVSMVSMQLCNYCSIAGLVRCGVCKAWYCSTQCQFNHWPAHRRDCVQPPALEWPDGTKYEPGQMESGSGKGVGLHQIEHVQDEVREVQAETFYAAYVPDVIKQPSTEELKEAHEATKSQDMSINQVAASATIKKEGVVGVEGVVNDTQLTNPITLEATNTKRAVIAPVLVSAGNSVKSVALLTAGDSSMDLKEKEVFDSTGGVRTSKKYGPATDIPVTVASARIAKPVVTQACMVPSKPVVTNALKIPAKPVVTQSLKIPAKTIVTHTVEVPTKPPVTQVVQVPTKPATKVPIRPAATQSGNVPTHPAVNQSVKVPAKPAVTQAAKVPSNQMTVVPPSALFPSYSPAYLSDTLPPQAPPPPGQKIRIVLPVDDLISPGVLSVRLAKDEANLLQLLEVMNESLPPPAPGWKVGKRETVAVYYDEIWYRGIAVKKMEGKFSVFLLDFGGLVTVAPDQLRPLPDMLRVSAAVLYQVCLAGLWPMEGQLWGEEVGQLMGQIVNSDVEYKLGVEFLGQVEGGRWLVKMKGLEDDEDIGQLLIDGGLARYCEDKIAGHNTSLVVEKIIPSKVTSRSSELGSEAKEVSSPLNVIIAGVSTPLVSAAESSPVAAPPVSPKIPRGVLPGNTVTVAGVCFLESPDTFYVCSSISLEMFMPILTACQSDIPGEVSPMVGSSCLAMDDDCWYRAEIVNLSCDKITATLFLLDYGKTMACPVSSLRPMSSDLASTPGLVCKVTLRGVRPREKKWMEEEIAGALLVLDVGGETQFKVKNVEVDEELKTVVSMEDMEGNDITALMVETGIAEEDDNSEIMLVPSTLALGEQTLLVLAAVSPMELYLCSQDKFFSFSSIIVPMLEEAASHAALVLSPKEGDIVLACEDNVWYRACVLELVNDNTITVKLLDLASITTLPRDKLRTASPAHLKHPVLAVPCCLASWRSEDTKVAIALWGGKMDEVVEQFGEMEVDVVEVLDGKVIVKIHKLEQKFGKKQLCRAELLKTKLKMMQK